MSVPSRPESLLAMLLASQSCFHAPSSRTFQGLVLGWTHCLERHTVTGVVVAAGLVGVRHISVGSRFFARAQWSLDAVGQVVFRLALRWISDDQPLSLLGDDPLTRRQGNCVSLASMHHDPLLSSGRKRCYRFGHGWVVLALWVPLPMSQQRGFALPILVRLSTGAKRGGTRDARWRPTTSKRLRVTEAAHASRDRPTKVELLRELVGLVASWTPRSVSLVVDSASVGRTTLEGRPANVGVSSRLRVDAALGTVPPPVRRRGAAPGRSSPLLLSSEKLVVGRGLAPRPTGQTLSYG